MERQTLRNILITLSASLFIVVAIYAFNLWLWSTLGAQGSYYAPKISIHDALFIEGIATILLGITFFLGRGGIRAITVGAARIVAAVKAIFGEDSASINETFRKDAWKPKGFTRVALTMIIAGAILLLCYFLL